MTYFAFLLNAAWSAFCFATYADGGSAVYLGSAIASAFVALFIIASEVSA